MSSKLNLRIHCYAYMLGGTVWGMLTEKADMVSFTGMVIQVLRFNFLKLQKKCDLKECALQITEPLLLSHMQVKSFFGSYWKGPKNRQKRKLQTNRQ